MAGSETDIFRPRIQFVTLTQHPDDDVRRLVWLETMGHERFRSFWSTVPIAASCVTLASGCRTPTIGSARTIARWRTSSVQSRSHDQIREVPFGRAGHGSRARSRIFLSRRAYQSAPIVSGSMKHRFCAGVRTSAGWSGPAQNQNPLRIKEIESKIRHARYKCLWHRRARGVVRWAAASSGRILSVTPHASPILQFEELVLYGDTRQIGSRWRTFATEQL